MAPKRDGSVIKLGCWCESQEEGKLDCDWLCDTKQSWILFFGAMRCL